MPDVVLQPFGETISCKDDETILAGVLRHGRYIRYGCKGGGCGTCKVLLIEGDVDETGSSFALPASERAKGWVLACSSVPVEDSVIDVESMELTEEDFRAGDTTGSHAATVEALEPLTADISFLRLRLDAPMKFVAGQFVNVFPPGSDQSRSYSMANPPSQPDVIDLVVKLLPGGFFSTYLRHSAGRGDRVVVQGPYGMLRVRLSHRRILMVAGGSGLAPLLSMLDDLAEKGNTRPVTLFFGARRRADLYFEQRIRDLELAMPLEFIPALSEDWPEDWAGETGLVSDAVARRRPNLEGYDAYLCGPPPMIDATRPLLIARGVRERNIYFDAFAPTGGVP